MDIFQYTDYRKYVVEKIKRMPSRGRGEYLRIAQHLAMQTSGISQVFKGKRNLTLEQGAALAEYFALTELESEYFLNLINLERAGTKILRQMHERQLKKLRAQSEQLVHRLSHEKVLSESDRTMFYSDWFYIALQLATDIPGLNTADALAAHFALPRKTVTDVLGFLTRSGLCSEDHGQFKMGTQRTHLEANSPLIARHHTNWRLKAIERCTKLNREEELQLSSPMSLSHKDILKIRRMLLTAIESMLKTAAASPSEEVYCLNIDWIKIL